MIRWIAFSALLVWASLLSAQESLKFQGHLLIGGCAAQVHGDGISGFNKLGATAGIGVDVWRGDGDRRWSWDMLYTQKGSRRVPNPKAGDYNTWRYRFTYLDLPVVRTWHFDTDWWFGLGLQPSVLLAGEEDFYQNGFTELTYVDLRPWDIGGVVSVGISWGEHFGLEARLGQSLLPISEQPEQPIQRFDNFMMNMAVQFAVRWSMGEG